MRSQFFPLWVNQGGSMSADQSGLIAQWNIWTYEPGGLGFPSEIFVVWVFVLIYRARF
jgi:hypothetical protein